MSEETKTQWAILNSVAGMSPTIGKFAEALAKAQLEADAAKKDSTNPHFKSKYAGLSSVIDVTKVLNAHGIAVVQDVYTAQDGGAACVTTLMHTSGEWKSSQPLILPVAKKDAQGYGSAFTYAKRYSLSAAANIAADEDDDGNAAVGKPSGDIVQSSKPRPQAANSDKPLKEIANMTHGAEGLRNKLEAMKASGDTGMWEQAKKEAQALKAKGVEFDDDFRALYSAVKALADKKAA